ncbi:choline transporter-like protein 2 isoform X2 [Mytilus californianus]|uniref:choline transporter-like protein 2 isoform X2 n=1 Tax=Mytilus californianus TaxID=6549 RepID=UPI002245C3FC|nr:choline transporter-like protein 2 isoform X2 [Mytilus californianus]
MGSKDKDKEEIELHKNGKIRKHDKDFKGPIENRSCTDIICCLLFLVFIFGLIAVSILGFVWGNPNRLLHPTDSSGLICGYDAEVKDRPYLVYFDISKCAQMGPSAVALGCPTPQVCRKSCTTEYYVYLETVAKATVGLLQQADIDKMVCKDGINITESTSVEDIQKYVGDNDCAAYYVETTDIVGRCIPSIFKTILETAKDVITYTAVNTDGSNITYNLTNTDNTLISGNLISNGTGFLALFYSASQEAEMIFKDVVSAWHLIVIFLVIAMVACFVWIVIMRWITGFMVWFSIFAVLGVMGFGCYYSYSQYYDLKNSNSTSEFGIAQAFALNFSYYLTLKETWLAFGCTTATFLIIFLLILIFLCHRICIAIKLIEEGSKAIGNMIFTLFWPIIPFLLQIIMIAYMAVAAVFVASMGGKEYYRNDTSSQIASDLLSDLPCNESDTTFGEFCGFVKYGGDQYIIPLEVFLLFMFFWLMNFIIALGQMTLAGAFASYYWAANKSKDIPTMPVLSSFYRSIRYHLGSLAFGSLIIAIIKMIRVLLEYIDAKLKNSENPVAKFLIKCMKCCFWCLEKFIKFLNRNAYIMIAVYGRSFCPAAKDAFFLIFRNVVRAMVLDKVTDYVLFISKLVVTAGVGVGAYFWFQGKVDFFTDYLPKLNYYLVPVIVVIMGTYVIAATFFNVYTMAVDTLFLCFLEDLEVNNGEDRPYRMGKGLQKLLSKKNKKYKEPEEENRA